MPRLIDADKIEPTEIYNGEWVRVAYMDDIDELPTVDVDSLNAKHEDIGYEKGYRDGYAEALEMTDDANRHGHWIESHEVFDYIKCSECGEDWCTEDNDTETFNYCPNCGAKMDEVGEDD